MLISFVLLQCHCVPERPWCLTGSADMLRQRSWESQLRTVVTQEPRKIGDYFWSSWRMPVQKLFVVELLWKKLVLLDLQVLLFGPSSTCWDYSKQSNLTSISRLCRTVGCFQWVVRHTHFMLIYILQWIYDNHHEIIHSLDISVHHIA